MSAFDKLVDGLIGREGGYVNNPNDPGGATRWGITQRVARKYGYQGDMRTLPRDTAVDIYRQQYWTDPGFADVAAISEAVAEELLDSGVNLGVTWPALWLQVALNGLNNQGKIYADVDEDGDVGPGTLRALKAYFAARGKEGEAVLLRALNCLQGARYIDIARGRQASEGFLYGWLRTRVS